MSGSDALVEQLISEGIVEASPITYEDFLPISAAGIFQSNLHSQGEIGKALDLKHAASDLKGFKDALGAEPLQLENWYAHVQQESLSKVAKELGLNEGDLV